MKKETDIYSRSFNFAIDLIKIVQDFSVHPRYFKITDQVIRSSTSVGANIIEAQNSRSRPEFISIMGIALREAAETLHWLKLIEALDINQGFDLLRIKKENLEIIRILSSIIASSKRNLR
ncbi:four helix bundle protein [Patescibacteria group bacterium]